MREEIISLGGTVMFNSKVTEFIIKDHVLQGVVINNEHKIKTNVCLLGIGHSARDTFELLYNSNITITQKAFSVGVRIEHPQTLINEAQYGKYASEPHVGAADYKLSYFMLQLEEQHTHFVCVRVDG